jgi:D-amino-acid dehydrogenase
LRYNPAFLARHTGWTAGFLNRARGNAYLETAAALDRLISLSISEHQRLMQEAGIAHRYRKNGWFFLYRTAAAFDKGQLGRNALDRFGVATETLDRAAIQAMEPSLKPIFEKGLWVQDAMSVDSPGRVTGAYAELFVSRGGKLDQGEIQTIRPALEGGWQVEISGRSHRRYDQVVVALGPWSRDFLKHSLNIRIPMAFERGYFAEYHGERGATLSRPVYDTAGAYVLSPMQDGLRLTSGVELTHQSAAQNLAQLCLAEASAREAFPLAGTVRPEVVVNSRPTLPDSRPMIGEAPRHPGLWFAFGHQHIGFSTGPGTAILLGEMMAGDKTNVAAEPFRPDRF